MTSLNLLDNYTESPDHRADYLETENIIDFDILIQDLIISLYNIQI